MATNWTIAADQDSVDQVSSKIGESSDNETKQIVFGRLWGIRNVVDWCKTWLTDKLDMKISNVNANSILPLNKRPTFIDGRVEVYFPLTPIPTKFFRGGVAAVGTDIYLFGSSVGGAFDAYRYDTLTDTYTTIANIPFPSVGIKAVSVGTDIYLFTINSSTVTYKFNYKYDTLTNTYTKKLTTLVHGQQIVLLLLAQISICLEG